MALALALCERLQERDVPVPESAVAGLERWFAENVTTEESLDEFSATAEAGIEGKAGIQPMPRHESSASPRRPSSA